MIRKLIWSLSALVGALLFSGIASSFGIGAAYTPSALYYRYVPHQNRVHYNPGGLNEWFAQRFGEARARGDTYKLDGFCESACTFITGTIPVDRVCITRYVHMGFHASFWIDGKDVRHFSPEGTEEMWLMFSPAIQAMLKKRGWSGPDKDQPTLIWLHYDDLKTIYKTCEDK